jgi:hypothetical protein
MERLHSNVGGELMKGWSFRVQPVPLTGWLIKLHLPCIPMAVTGTTAVAITVHAIETGHF